MWGKDVYNLPNQFHQFKETAAEGGAKELILFSKHHCQHPLCYRSAPVVTALPRQCMSPAGPYPLLRLTAVLKEIVGHRQSRCVKHAHSGALRFIDAALGGKVWPEVNI